MLFLYMKKVNQMKKEFLISLSLLTTLLFSQPSIAEGDDIVLRSGTYGITNIENGLGSFFYARSQESMLITAEADDNGLVVCTVANLTTDEVIVEPFLVSNEFTFESKNLGSNPDLYLVYCVITSKVDEYLYISAKSQGKAQRGITSNDANSLFQRQSSTISEEESNRINALAKQNASKLINKIH